MVKPPLYRHFQDFLKEHFETKIQKISLNAGFTCPNRDGYKGLGGCTYCNNQTFNPAYCKTEKSITQQLQEGILFFAKKYPNMDYLAYFQAYTNTYGELEKLKSLYEEALTVSGIKGLVIGTRPDCMPEDLLDYLEELSKKYFILIEYGLESTKEETLRLINRGHDFDCSADAVRRTAQRGLFTGAHLILGLPGESKEDILGHAGRL
ncbi:MAG: TIGR01212 family radical SAM protein, partial [Bacteroidales bacterium]|nr:TIGR01212 family radical SAM protein [Bacteroidales bacterium]